MAELHRGHLVFSCGASLYAVPAETAAEVVTLPLLTRVPGAPVHLVGVFAHRGEVLPVVDLARLAGKPLDEAFKRAVLVRGASGAVALTATRVLGVSQLEGKQDRLGDSGLSAHLRGPARGPAGEVAVIDPEGFFDFLARGGA
ncbi:MAG: chemotaxis protein CheW [Myxococcales bacterium]|nr:chemotaxis protein CheW [Myxococcales bacterium]